MNRRYTRMSTRFQVQSDGSRMRILDINGIHYKITVPEDIWSSTKVTSHVGYWARRMRLGKQTTFKYGYVTIVEDVVENTQFECKECSKVYKTRDSLYKHIKRAHQDTKSLDVLSNPRTTIDSSVTNNHITNNITNNINNTINITLRPFGEENPKWLTAELLFEALQNLNGAIPRLLQEKHFNDSFPENQNIQISDIRHLNKRLRVYEKSGWRIRNREKILRSAMDKAYNLLYDAVHNDADDTEDEDTDETTLSRKEIRRLHTSRRAKRAIERALQAFDEFRPYTTPTAENINDEVDTMLLDKRERERVIGDFELGTEIDSPENDGRE